MIARPATEFDAGRLAPRLRAQDRREVDAATGLDPSRALEISRQLSDMAWSVVIDGRVEAMFGVGHDGAVWMLGSQKPFENPRRLMRFARAFLPQMARNHPVLWNYLDARNADNLRWLRRLGFMEGSTVPYGPRGLPFIRFYAHV